MALTLVKHISPVKVQQARQSVQNEKGTAVRRTRTISGKF